MSTVDQNLLNTCIPEYAGQNFSMKLLYGKCKCNHGVKGYDKYCSQCGAKLDWESLRKNLESKYEIIL